MVPSLRVAVAEENPSKQRTAQRIHNVSLPGDNLANSNTSVVNEEGAVAIPGTCTAVTMTATHTSTSALPTASNACSGSDIELSRVQNRYAKAWKGSDSECGLGEATGGSEIEEKPTLIKLQDFVNTRSNMSDSTLLCVICNIKANSKEHLETHMAGKPHKKRKAMFEQDLRLEKKYADSRIIHKVSLGKWKCIPCKAEMGADAVDGHVQGKSHRSAMKRFQPSAIANTTPNGSTASCSNRSTPSPIRPDHRQLNARGGGGGGGGGGVGLNTYSRKHVVHQPIYTSRNQHLSMASPARAPLLAYPNAQPGFTTQQYYHMNPAIPTPAPNPSVSNTHSDSSVPLHRTGFAIGGGTGGVGLGVPISPQVDMATARYVPPRAVELSPAYQSILDGLSANNLSIVSPKPQPHQPQPQPDLTTMHQQAQVESPISTANTKLNANAKEFRPFSAATAPLAEAASRATDLSSAQVLTNVAHQVAVGSSAFAQIRECGVEILPARNASVGHSRIRQSNRVTSAAERSLNSEVVRDFRQMSDMAQLEPPAKQVSPITEAVQPVGVSTSASQLNMVAQNATSMMPQATQNIVSALQGRARVGGVDEIGMASLAIPAGGGVVVEMPPLHVARAPDEYVSANAQPVEVHMPGQIRMTSVAPSSESTQRSAPISPSGRGRPLKKKKGEEKEELYYCRICDIRCTSEGNLQEHMRSVKHLRKMGIPQNNGNGQRNDEKKCDVCDVVVYGEKNWINHVNGAKHKKKVNVALAPLTCVVVNPQ